MIPLIILDGLYHATPLLPLYRYSGMEKGQRFPAGGMLFLTVLLIPRSLDLVATTAAPSVRGQPPKRACVVGWLAWGRGT